MITMKQYLTADGKYPEREKHPEVTPELIKNATILLDKVNKLLNDLGIQSVIVSSGFRPSGVNAAIANAAKRSAHLTGEAIDIADSDGSLDELLDESDVLLKKYNLFQEDPASTKGWAHLDIRQRGPRKKNQFIP